MKKTKFTYKALKDFEFKISSNNHDIRIQRTFYGFFMNDGQLEWEIYASFTEGQNKEAKVHVVKTSVDLDLDVLYSDKIEMINDNSAVEKIVEVLNNYFDKG